jgi:hypothetical protein
MQPSVAKKTTFFFEADCPPEQAVAITPVE